MKVGISSSASSVGGTFVDWSIHFLSGQTVYYQAKQHKWIELTHNPLDSNSTAHKHQKNHPRGSVRTAAAMAQFDQLPGDQLFSAYFYPMSITEATQQLGFDITDLGNSQYLQAVHDCISVDYANTFTQCYEQDARLIMLAPPPVDSLYSLTPRATPFLLLESRPAESSDEKFEDDQRVFFNRSVETWRELGLTHKWDIRERLALDTRPFIYVDYNPTLTMPHLWIDSRDLWINGAAVIHRIMNYLQLPIHSNRFTKWLEIYYEWQKIHAQALEFGFYYTHIVDAIVNDAHFEIDLTFEQEVVIQHCLIYKHNLNLKTWNLEKFPSNTRLLHKLLEPNIHNISDIY
jgi:hypothetical protein